jgi:hypothetical protein
MRHKVAVRVLAVCGLLCVVVAVVAFLWHPTALAKSSLCVDLPHPVGPCVAFRGAAGFGAWGPARGWVLAVVGGVGAALAVAVVWAIHRDAAFFPFNEF